MSKALERSVKSLVKHNKEGSYSTHANRGKRLDQAVQQLADRYPDLHDLRNLKPRHIDYLVERWKSENLSPGTIKNRMSDLRWVTHKIDKANIMHRTNDEYGIDRRQYINNDINKAKTLDASHVEQMKDPYVQFSLKLQSEFGLRREESIKFDAFYADKGDHIELKSTWCKGGRTREIPILNQSQRQLLDEIKSFQREQGARALIPPDKNYISQLKRYENVTNRGGEKNNHGLRHQYAQDRYRTLTGWECPNCGGKNWKALTAEEKTIDEKARFIITQELGHNRLDIVANYIGK
ncbi:phage integrase N-terminal domain-containing protein [Ostreibacterium oceani]|uniref:Integrase n=1 Tax=Ostreibacterium oceani TaxID=2654998 RepID=A0A6N7F547_9GAMM|nr:phage integrase N-terminal domain-containing protein [Ostreibacterium oceani]MPV87006.1 integrase [Ostreibacterium oceani]